jgi:hypothetical protein
LFFGFCFLASAQTTPQIGDELRIKAPTSQTYTYVKFPRPNILIKRGVVTRYKSVYGNAVVIDDVVTNDKGSTYVMLKKKDGTKFFGLVTTVKANYTKAIAANEIAVLH